MSTAIPTIKPKQHHVDEARVFARRLRAAIRRKATTRVVCRKLLATLSSLRRSRYAFVELGPWLTHNRLWIDHNCRIPMPSAQVTRLWNEAVASRLPELWARELRMAA